jgi:aspartoacylase
MTSATHKTTQRIEQVMLVGGTHGNERTGINCIRHWQTHPEHIQRPSFSIETVIGNPEATLVNQRYLDKDLNRCFAKAVQEDTDLTNLREVKRAKTLLAQIQEATKPTDFLIDLHTTTTNMGVTLIFEQANWLTYTILTSVAKAVDGVHFLYEPRNEASPYLISSAPQGLMIEVGPIAQGLMLAETYQKTSAAVTAVLDAIEHYNQFSKTDFQALQANNLTLPVYEVYNTIPYPTDTQGEAIAMVHPLLQDSDFQQFLNKTPEFLFFSGEVQHYEGPDFFPVFVNEAAYYDQAKAYSRAKKFDLDFNEGPSL